MKKIESKKCIKRASIVNNVIVLLLSVSLFALLSSEGVLTAFAFPHANEEYTIEDIRQILGQPDWEADEYLRIYTENNGVKTHPIVLQENLQGSQGIQTFSLTCSSCRGNVCAATTTRTVMRQSSQTNPIVVVLFGDGFVAGTGANQQGVWNAGSPNPTASSFLWHAQGAMNYMLSQHPFSLFADHFTLV